MTPIREMLALPEHLEPEAVAYLIRSGRMRNLYKTRIDYLANHRIAQI